MRNPTPTTNTTAATLIATFQMKEFDDNISRCADFCGHQNLESTHLTVSGLTCECFSNLTSFHCEEEEGEPLVNVYCIETKPEEVKSIETQEVIFSWREPLDLLPSNLDPHIEMETLREDASTTTALTLASNTAGDDEEDISTSSTDSAETSVILVAVLLIAAVLLLIGMCAKTCFDIRKQKKSDVINKRLQENSDTFTSISIS